MMITIGYVAASVLLWFLFGYFLSKAYYGKDGFRGTYIPRRHRSGGYINCWCTKGSEAHSKAEKLQVLYDFADTGKPGLIFLGITFWPYPAMGLLIEKVRVDPNLKESKATPAHHGLFDADNK